MSTALFLSTLGWFLLFAVASYSMGALLTKKVKMSLMLVGIRIMIGLGLIGNLGLMLALLGKFERVNMILILVVLVLIGLKKELELINYFKSRIVPSLKLIKLDLLASLVLGFSILVAGSLYLSSMSPPHATDELHYHFPQARSVAETGKVGWSWDGHYFYGNIPKLMEAVFAEGLVISDYSLAHALNYLMLVGFLILVFGLIKKRYGYRAAVFSTTFLLLFEDLTWNATVGFVDAATSALEIGALLLVGEWVSKRKDNLLMMAGLLLGLGLGMKYSPLPTALYLTIIILIVNFRKILIFGLPAFLIGGYWYIKNWILLGNPFYPMYFGHVGVSKEVYQRLMNAIWQWEPKTLHTFMDKLKRWWSYSGSTTYMSIWLAPLALLTDRKSKFLLILVGYYALYIPYWFFLATHQTRFLLTGLVVASILAGIFLSKVSNKVLWIGLVAIVAISFRMRPYPGRNLLEHYLWIKLHTVERQYATGNLNKDEYLSREFGCQYEVVDYLNQRSVGVEVIDNWSIWHAPSVNYFSKNTFSGFDYSDGVDMENIVTKIKQKNYKYLYVNEKVRRTHVSDLSPSLTKRTTNLVKVDREIDKYLDIEYENGDCKLYKVNVD